MIRVYVRASSPAAAERLEGLLRPPNFTAAEVPEGADVLLVEGENLEEALAEGAEIPIVVWVRDPAAAGERLAEALEAIETPRDARTAGQGEDEPLVEALTPREEEVLGLMAAGLGNKQIAARLDISEHTAKFHVASIMGKLGAGSRTEAVTAGIRRGLIPI